jgi:hypothetical protein
MPLLPPARPFQAGVSYAEVSGRECREGRDISGQGSTGLDLHVMERNRDCVDE